MGGIAKAAAIGIAAAASAIAGVAVISVRAAMDEQAGMERLAQAVRANGGDWDALGATIEGQIAKWERLTAFSDTDMRDALSTLTALTGDAATAMDRLPVAMDFARGAGLDLTTTSRLLGKVTDETTTVLARFGIRVEKGADAMDVLAKVQQKFGGQSAAFAKTAAGQWQIFTNQVQNLKEAIGFALLPAFIAFTGLAIKAIDAVRAKFEEIRPAVAAGITAISTGFSAVWNSGPVQFFVGTVITELAKIPTFIGNVLGAIGEIFEVLSGKGRPEAGGVLRAVVGDNLAEGIQTTMKNVRTAFTDAFDIVKPIIQGVIDKVHELKDAFDKLPPALRNFAGQAVAADVGITGLALTLSAISQGLVATTTLLGRIVGTSIFAKLIKGFLGMNGAILGAVGGMSVFDPLIAGVFTALSLPIAPLLLLVAAIAAVGIAIALLITHWDDVSSAATMLAQIVGIVVGRAFDALGTAVSNFFAPFGKLLALFTTDAPFALGLLLGAIVGTFGAAQAAVGDAIKWMADTFGNFLNVLGGWKTDLGNIVGSALQGLLDGIGNFAGRAIPVLAQFVINAVGEFFKLAPQFAQAAADAIGGFIGGIVGAIPNAVATIIDAAKQLIGGFNAALQNRSPSKVFAEAGLNITRGLVVGIRQGVPAVNAALGGIGLASIGGLSAGGGGARGGDTITIAPTIHLHYSATGADPKAAGRLASDTLDIITESMRQQMRRLSVTA